MSPLAEKLVNVSLYQVGWFCCVLGGAWGFAGTGTIAALLLLVVHLLLAEARNAELRLMIATCLLGVTIDSAQQFLGVFSFKPATGWPLWLPPWVFVIWAQFATLFRFALFWLSGRYLLGAVLGLTGGPLAYWAGIRLGAAEFGANPATSMLSLALVWALVVPCLSWLSTRIDPREGRYRLRTSGH